MMMAHYSLLHFVLPPGFKEMSDRYPGLKCKPTLGRNTHGATFTFAIAHKKVTLFRERDEHRPHE